MNEENPFGLSAAFMAIIANLQARADNAQKPKKLLKATTYRNGVPHLITAYYYNGEEK